MDKDQARRALSLLAGLQMDDEREKWASASSWVVRYHDPDTPDTDTYYGPFGDERAAFEHARVAERRLNAGLGANETPFRCVVVPVIAPSP